MAKAFAQQGVCRNAMLVDCAVNITLYIMVHRLPQSMGSDRRVQLYEDSIKWLRDVQASKASSDMPKYATPTAITPCASALPWAKSKKCTW